MNIEDLDLKLEPIKTVVLKDALKEAMTSMKDEMNSRIDRTDSRMDAHLNRIAALLEYRSTRCYCQESLCISLQDQMT